MGTSSTGTSVAPEKILKDLAALWISQAQEGKGAGGTGVLRACSMTLVVLTEIGPPGTHDDAAELGETIAALMPQHPARALVVRLSGAGPRALTERVYQQCWRPFGQRQQICCEQIEITASDAALADLPSLLLPLAVPDLPLIVWCRATRLARMPEFHEIAAMATKVVMDSAAFPDVAEALQTMADATRQGIMIGDLSWTRLTRWREMLSHVFENRDYLTKLAGVSEVRVEFGRDFGVSAWLMGAWVVNALGDAGVQAKLAVKSVETAGGAEGRSEGAQAASHQAASHQAGAHEAASHLRLELAGPEIHVQLVRQEERLVITVNDLSNCTNLPQPSDFLQMREELGIISKDAVFERSLVSAARLAYATDK